MTPRAPRTTPRQNTRGVNPTLPQIEEMQTELETIVDKISSFEAYYHEFGQSEWTGGGGNKEPTYEMRRVFKALRDARDQLHAAEHALHDVLIDLAEDGVKEAQALGTKLGYPSVEGGE